MEKINNSSNTRLLLDLPFRYGMQHLKQAFSADNAPKTLLTDVIPIELAASNFYFKALSLKNRIIHLVVGTLECIPIVGIIVACVDKFFQTTQDKYIRSRIPIEPHQHAWFLNLALLREAQKTANGKEKKHIEFLATNFLNKVTPKMLKNWISFAQKVYHNYTPSHVVSPIDEYSYHRENIDHRYFYGEKFNEELAYSSSGLFVLLDTTEIDPYLSLSFQLINKKQSPEDYKKIIYNQLLNHAQTITNSPWSTNFTKPIIIDTTNILDASIHTQKNKKKERAFRKCFEDFKKTYEKAEKEVIDQLIQEKPELAEHKTAILNLLRKNTGCVHKVTSSEYSAIKFLPWGCYQTLKQQEQSPIFGFQKNTGWWMNFLTNSGLYINAVDLRKLMSNVFEQRPDVEYFRDAYMNPSQLQAIYFSSKQSLTSSCLFQRLACIFGSKMPDENLNYGCTKTHLEQSIDFMAQKPHLKMMGKLTIDLLQGLMQEVSQETWENIHENPAYRQIFQSSLFKIQNHLADAELLGLANKFDQYMQKIELIHAELATLLELTQPFSKQDFDSIYKKQLVGKSIPENLKLSTKCGIAKSATNIFSGILVAAQKKDGQVHSVAGTNSYYEHAILTHQNYETCLNNPAAPKINVYHAQFFPNVDVGSDPVEYQKKDIFEDIKRLIDAGKTSEQFTAAIDLTIDDFYSDSVRELIVSFAKEIEEGKINFVFFTSGQKFYNVGMDHYYGAPFYVVNNGSKSWQAFEDLHHDPCLNPDKLSVQWFNLVTKYAADGLQDYRTLIFENTKAILSKIPSSLKFNPNIKQFYRVNQSKENTKSPFIDLKILDSPSRQRIRSINLKKLFFKMLQKENMEACTRGSFGFFHCNFSVFGHLSDKARTVRINPGINPEENEKILKFLNEVGS